MRVKTTQEYYQNNKTSFDRIHRNSTMSVYIVLKYVFLSICYIILTYDLYTENINIEPPPPCIRFLNPALVVIDVIRITQVPNENDNNYESFKLLLLRGRGQVRLGARRVSKCLRIQIVSPLPAGTTTRYNCRYNCSVIELTGPVFQSFTDRLSAVEFFEQSRPTIKTSVFQTQCRSPAI